jgi:hypothetical protein
MDYDAREQCAVAWVCRVNHVDSLDFYWDRLPRRRNPSMRRSEGEYKLEVGRVACRLVSLYVKSQIRLMCTLTRASC